MPPTRFELAAYSFECLLQMCQRGEGYGSWMSGCGVNDWMHKQRSVTVSEFDQQLNCPRTPTRVFCSATLDDVTKYMFRGTGDAGNGTGRPTPAHARGGCLAHASVPGGWRRSRPNTRLRCLRRPRGSYLNSRTRICEAAPVLCRWMALRWTAVSFSLPTKQDGYGSTQIL